MVLYSNTHSIACKITTTNKKVKHGYQAKGHPLHAIGAHRVVGEQCPDDFNLFGAVMQHTRVLSEWLQRRERALGVSSSLCERSSVPDPPGAQNKQSNNNLQTHFEKDNGSRGKTHLGISDICTKRQNKDAR